MCFKKVKIYSGKTKDLLKVIPSPGNKNGKFANGDRRYILHFKDNILGRNNIPDSGGNEIVGVARGKGVASCDLTAFFMGVFKKNGIPTHFIKKINRRDILIRVADKIPIEFILRNYAYGSYLRRHPSVKPLSPFRRPVIEYTLKSDESDDPLMSLKETLRYVSRQELEEIKSIIRRINRLLLALCRPRGVMPADFKVEFGRVSVEGKKKSRVVLIDDFSTDTARFFSLKDKRLLDYKDVLEKFVI